MVQRKQIDTRVGQEALSCLHEVSDERISARKFIVTNFELLQQSQKDLRALHGFLLTRGVDVGSFGYFRDIFNREKRDRRLASNTLKIAPTKQHTEISEPSEPKTAANPIEKSEKTISECKRGEPSLEEVSKAPVKAPTGETCDGSKNTDTMAQNQEHQAKKEVKTWRDLDPYALERAIVSNGVLHYISYEGARRFILLDKGEDEEIEKWKKERKKELEQRFKEKKMKE